MGRSSEYTTGTTNFGRDSLFPALMGGIDGNWMAEGALAALAPHQARVRDDFRDAEPGKLPHELRYNELTQLATIELQGYLYAARLAMAELMEERGVFNRYCRTGFRAWNWRISKSAKADVRSPCGARANGRSLSA
jgi:hypothetical protein